MYRADHPAPRFHRGSLVRSQGQTRIIAGQFWQPGRGWCYAVAKIGADRAAALPVVSESDLKKV